jgi:uncharacterized protein
MLTKDAILAYYSNGQIEWKIPIEWHVYGAYRRHGEAFSYYPTGEIKSRRTFEHGAIVGEEMMYYRDGSVMSVVPFKNGRIDGVHIFRHPNGREERKEYEQGLIKHDAKSERAAEPKKILPRDHIPASLLR